MMERGNLLHNLVLFGRLLRGLGLDVSPGRMVDLVQALRHIDIGRKADFYHTTRSLLIHRHEDLPLFDKAFDAFWRQPPESRDQLALASLGERNRRRRQSWPTPAEQRKGSAGPETSDEVSQGEPPARQITMTYSSRELLRFKDFADLTSEEVEAIKRMMYELVWYLGERRSRRHRPGRGSRLDLRRTFRHNLRYGGEVLQWARRKPKFKPRPLVVLADVSGSMERYTRLLLHFVYSLAGGLEQSVEAFLFSTRLTRITRQLRGRDIEGVLRQVSRRVPDWSGGTRIGEALREFNFRWARRVLSHGAVVLVISDGWDRGDIPLLRSEMARLQRSCYRLIWLNPLLGMAEYEPLARGMQTALPYVDDFLPVHNLASLEELAAHLGQLEDRRPVRRQQPTVA